MRPTVPLTADQQELVASHEWIARWVAGQVGRNSGPEDVLDMAQTAAVAMCRAAQLWRPERRAKFSTYAAVACRHAIRDKIFGRRKGGPADRSRRTGQLVIEPTSAQVLADDHLDFESLLAWLAPEDRDILTAWLDGETFRSIAKRRGCHRHVVARAVGRILGELRGRFPRS